MKCLITVFLVVYSVVVVFGQSPEKIAMMMKIVADCKESSGASVKDVEILMSKVEPETHNGKCMFACIFEKIGIFKDGKIVKDKFVPWLAAQKGSSNEIAELVYNQCNAITDPDPCLQIVHTGNCFRATCAEHGFVPDLQ